MALFFLGISAMTAGTRDAEGREHLVASFFKGTGSTYDLVVQVFTLGLDSSWKREILYRVPPSKRILDLGCGTGIVSQGLARRFPNAEIVGVDVTEDYLAIYEERLRGIDGLWADPCWAMLRL
jgi:ubiquinone/menaquinone biosynthesis C-methylase UbiE